MQQLHPRVAVEAGRDQHLRAVLEGPSRVERNGRLYAATRPIRICGQVLHVRPRSQTPSEPTATTAPVCALARAYRF
jgi:hypothetical protein